MKILSCFTGAVLFECAASSMKLTLKAAIKAGANLRSANLSGANLRSANLSGANLRSADLRSADLRSADLRSADLSGANLSGANLSGANLHSANLPRFQIPQEGSITVFKKLRAGVIAKLEIPTAAKRIATPIGRKCRAEFALVLELSNGADEGHAQHDDSTYRVGEIVRPDSYDDDIRVECTHGIHFFLTREEAEEY